MQTVLRGEQTLCDVLPSLQISVPPWASPAGGNLSLSFSNLKVLPLISINSCFP